MTPPAIQVTRGSGHMPHRRKHWRDCLHRYIRRSERVPSKRRNSSCQRWNFAGGLLSFANGKVCGHTRPEEDSFLERDPHLHGLIDSKESEQFVNETLNQFCPDGIAVSDQFENIDQHKQHKLENKLVNNDEEQTGHIHGIKSATVNCEDEITKEQHADL
eukprot:scaffold3246_cov137-Chaetoceros_neogracile.AAC.1